MTTLTAPIEAEGLRLTLEGHDHTTVTLVLSVDEALGFANVLRSQATKYRRKQRMARLLHYYKCIVDFIVRGANNMADPGLLRDLMITYRGHTLRTNHGQAIRNFMTLHGLPGATQIIALVKTLPCDRFDMGINGENLVIERDDRY